MDKRSWLLFFRGAKTGSPRSRLARMLPEVKSFNYISKERLIWFLYGFYIGFIWFLFGFYMVMVRPANMTSIVEHQRASGCFREKGREPDRQVEQSILPEQDKYNNDENTVGEVVPHRQAAEGSVSQVKVGVHLQLGHLPPTMVRMGMR